MVKRIKCVCIGVLAAFLAVSLGMGVILAKNDSAFAQTGATVGFDNILSVSGADITANQTHTGAVTGNSYSGLTVSGTAAYDGKFNATFDGDTDLRFKFPGVADTNVTNSNAKKDGYALCDGNGDFCFTIASAADPSVNFELHIVKTIAGSGDATAFIKVGDLYITSNYGNIRYYDSEEGIKKYHQQQSYCLGFNSDETKLQNGITLKQNASGNWVFTVIHSYYNLSGNNSWSVEFSGANVTANGKTKILPQLDFASGYTISFGSNYEAGESDNGTDVCFVSLNGESLATDTVYAEIDNDITYDGRNGDDLEFSATVTASTYLGDIAKSAKIIKNVSEVQNGEITVTADLFETGKTYAKTFEIGGESVIITINENGEVKTESVQKGEKYALTTAIITDKTFVGWQVGENVYPAGYEITVNSDITITALGVELKTIKGAAIRMSFFETSYGGLRFTAKYDINDVAALDVKFGMLILPSDYVGETEITHANLTEDKRLDVKCNATMPSLTAQGFGFTDTDKYAYFTGSIVNLYNYNYSRNFTARSYMQVGYGDGTAAYFYADYDATDNTRSAYEVATKAIVSATETEKILLNKYIDDVAAVTAGIDGETLDFARGDGSENAFTLSQNGGVYELAFERDVYSLMINGVRISKTTETEVLIGESVYVVSNLSVSGKTVRFAASKKA